jgi:hypothetical protein
MEIGLIFSQVTYYICGTHFLIIEMSLLKNFLRQEKLK